MPLAENFRETRPAESDFHVYKCISTFRAKISPERTVFLISLDDGVGLKLLTRR